MQNSASNVIHALVVYDHPAYRKGLCAILNTMPYRIFMDEASNGKEAVEAMRKKEYDIVLLDIRMKIMDGIEAARIIKRKYPDTKIIALTFMYHKINMIEILEIGVDGYILKDIENNDFVCAVDLVLQGNMYLSPEIHKEWSGYLVDKARNNCKKNATDLSEREIEILKLICKQMSSAQIVEKLFIAESTVNNHRVNLLKKTNSENIIGLLIYAINHGYFDPSAP